VTESWCWDYLWAKINLLQLSACMLQQWQTQMKTRRPSTGTTSWQACYVASLVQISYCWGDYNARIRKENDKWSLVMGKHGIGKCNSNGELLLALCSEFELIATNTMFKQTDERETTWMHPCSRHWHMIKFMITRYEDKMDIHSTQAMSGANYWTNHQMLRSKVAFRIWQKHNRQGTNKPTKFSTTKLSTIIHRESLEQEMDSALIHWEKENSTPDEEWVEGHIPNSQDISWQAGHKAPGLVRTQWSEATGSSYESTRPSSPESVANQEH